MGNEWHIENIYRRKVIIQGNLTIKNGDNSISISGNGDTLSVYLNATSGASAFKQYTTLKNVLAINRFVRKLGLLIKVYNGKSRLITLGRKFPIPGFFSSFSVL